MPAAPSDRERQSVAVPSALLREMIERTLFAVSVDETRMNLSGVFIERPENGKLRIVATDGHRLSMVTRLVEGAPTATGVIVPRKGVVELAKAMESGEEPVVLTAQGGVVHAERGAVELSMRLIEGEFPDYKQVLPQKSERRMLLGVEGFLAGLRRVSIISSERTRGVKLQLEVGRLDISSINPDIGEASEEVTVEYDGPPLSIGFNAKYLIDVLSVLSPAAQVEMGFNDEVSPAVIRSDSDPDYVYVVMPMRL